MLPVLEHAVVDLYYAVAVLEHDVVVLEHHAVHLDYAVAVLEHTLAVLQHDEAVSLCLALPPSLLQSSIQQM